jgi:hypothetical protein
VWELGDDGLPLIDERTGERVPVKVQRAKTLDEMNAAEKASWDAQVKDEEEWLIRSHRSQLERQILLDAAKAAAAAKPK